MLSHIPVIAVTGGPCGGKSTFLAEAQNLLSRHSIHAVIVSEVATELITGGVTPTLLTTELFQDSLLRYAIPRENAYFVMAETIQKKSGKRVVVLADRGMLDCEAYVGEKQFRRMLPLMGLERVGLLHRYDMVLHLVTAARGAEQYYTLANNAARSETVEQARMLDSATLHAWRGHPQLRIIDNSTDFAGKMKRALSALARILHMPEPLEIERRFKILNFNTRFIPKDAAHILIEQTYLVSPPHYDRRVRAETLEGVTRYEYTEKAPLADPIMRTERKRVIAKDEFERLVANESDPNYAMVRKLRYRFPNDGQIFEVDRFMTGRAAAMKLHVLEVELSTPHEPISIPSEWEVEEITADLHYRNRELARI